MSEIPAVDSTENRIQTPNVKESGKLAQIRQKVLNAFKRKEKPVTKESLPSTHIDVYLSSHMTAEDAQMKGKNLADYDVFIPEYVNRRPDTQKVFQSVADGKMSLDKATEYFKRGKYSHPEHMKGQLEEISGSKIAIGLMDTPYGHAEATAANSKANEDYTALIEQIRAGDFASGLATADKFVHDVSEYQGIRDDYMIAHLPQVIQELLKKNPALREKQDLKVLIKLGTAHTTLVNKMKQMGYEVGRQYSTDVMILPPLLRATVNLQLGKEVSEDLLAHVMLDRVLSSSQEFQQVKQLGASSEQLSEFLARVGSQFTLNEIKAFIEGLKNGQSGDISKGLGTLLGQKGIVIPQSKEELGAELAKYRKPKSAEPKDSNLT